MQAVQPGFFQADPPSVSLTIQRALVNHDNQDSCPIEGWSWIFPACQEKYRFEQNKHQWNLRQSNIYVPAIAVPTTSVSMDLSHPSADLLRHLTFQLRHLFSLRIFARTAGLGMSRLLLVELPQRLTAIEGLSMLQAPVGNVGSSFHPQKLVGTLDIRGHDSATAILMLFLKVLWINGFLPFSYWKLIKMNTWIPRRCFQPSWN